MIVHKILCDRCGADLSRINHQTRLEVGQYSISTFQEKYDESDYRLCKSCTSEFYKFLRYHQEYQEGE